MTGWRFFLTEETTEAIRSRFRAGESVESLMDAYDCPRPVVEMVVYTINTVD